MAGDPAIRLRSARTVIQGVYDEMGERGFARDDLRKSLDRLTDAIRRIEWEQDTHDTDAELRLEDRQIERGEQ